MAVNWQKVFTHAEYEFHFLEENSQADEGVHFLADVHTAHVIWLQHEKHFFHPPDVLDYFIWQEDCQMKFSLGNVQWYIGNQLLISHFIAILEDLSILHMILLAILELIDHMLCYGLSYLISIISIYTIWSIKSQIFSILAFWCSCINGHFVWSSYTY